ncbi:MAG: flagellar hook-basal body complex protein, partial [Syntrophales bacterium]|nr:flagellar hook-basal body complex protein [Syntrophales bacterium]
TNKMTWEITSSDAGTISGFASTSVVRTLANDGYSSGVLKSLSVGSNGIISGFFTNGQTSNLGQVILANFPNESGLKKVGNYFGATIESGEAIKNVAGSGGLGEIQANTLEVSNTDTAKEFISMITAQRAYQSSAKVVTTADQMLQVLMNIKQ